jgi:hypothetical protein
MSAISIIINILAFIALVIIISYVIYYIYNYWQNKITQYNTSLIYPPGAYMQSSGIKCPDYWVNTGIDPNGNYICNNSFNIPSVQPTSGSSQGLCNTNQLKFTPVQSGYTWDYNNPNGLTSYTEQQRYNFVNTTGTGSPISRCQWLNSCGPSSNVQGIWSGVNDVCNTPPTTPMS